MGNKVHQENFSYAGAHLIIKGANLTWTKYKSLNSASILITNNGDLSGYVTRIDVLINDNEGFSTVETEQTLIQAGETRTIEAKAFIFSMNAGTYTAILKLKEGLLGQGKTVATYSTETMVP